MFRGTIPAQDSKTVPVVRRGLFVAGSTFIKGAWLGVNAAGEWVQLATDPAATVIFGLSLEAAGSAPGFNVANDNQVIFRTGTEAAISAVDLAKQPDQVFSARFTDGAGVDVLPTQTLIGEVRGLLLLGTGEWTVNNADATGPAQIVDIILNLGAAAAGNRVLFRIQGAVATVLS